MSYDLTLGMKEAETMIAIEDIQRQLHQLKEENNCLAWLVKDLSHEREKKDKTIQECNDDAYENYMEIKHLKAELAEMRAAEDTKKKKKKTR